MKNPFALAWLSCSLLGCSTDMFVSGDGGEQGDAGQSDGPADGDVAPGNDAGSDGSPVDAGGDGYDGPPIFRRVFVTSGVYQGALGGAAGADSICNSWASSAGLGGTWAAWVSTATSDVTTRFVHSTVPWKLLDGTLVALDWSDLVGGAGVGSINRDEHNNLVSTPWLTWTSTTATGTSALSTTITTDCAGFTTSAPGSMSIGAVRGDTSEPVSDSSWTNEAWTPCDTFSALYCFEQ